jgi:sugar phosphate isomerase/epimerase
MLVAAAGLQCRQVCVDLGPPPVDVAMEELARRADRHGVAIAFRSDLCGFAELERGVKTGGCPWFLIDLDPVAILQDAWEADEIFSRVGERIGHVRGRDAILGTEKRTKAAVMGKGSIEWIEMLARLDAAGYHGWISVDPVELPNRAAAARAGAEVLRLLKLR